MYRIDEREAAETFKASDDDNSDTHSEDFSSTSVEVRRLLKSIKLDPDLAALRARHDDDQNLQDEFRKKETNDPSLMKARDTKSDNLTYHIYMESCKRKCSEDKT